MNHWLTQGYKIEIQIVNCAILTITNNKYKYNLNNVALRKIN